MNRQTTGELKDQVFRLCRKLSMMNHPINLSSEKADETLCFWLPEISLEDLRLYKGSIIPGEEIPKKLRVLRKDDSSRLGMKL